MWKNILLNVINHPRLLTSMKLRPPVISVSLDQRKIQFMHMHNSNHSCIIYNRFSHEASQTSQIIKLVETKVPSFCNITVNSFCNIVITPTDSQEHPNSDKLEAYLTETGPLTTENVNLDISQLDSNNFTVSVCLDGKQQHPSTSNIICSLNVPVQSNLAVFCSGDKNALVRDMQGAKLSVTSEMGCITTKNIRCTQINLCTTGGDIQSKGVLQGDIQLSTSQNGNIECQRLQGRSARMNTEAGDIKISSTYCNESFFQTERGHMKLDSLHRNCTALVKQSGSLVVSGLDGSLQAQVAQGDADIQVSSLRADSVVEAKHGDIRIRLTDASSCHLQLEAIKINIPQSFKKNDNDLEVVKGDLSIQHISNGDVSLKSDVFVLKAVSTKGKVELFKADWISTLKLGFKNKEKMN